MTGEVVSKQTWMNFVQEGSLDNRILSSEIIHSWQLCRKHRVNPFDSGTTQILTKDDFEKRIRENQLLLHLTKQSLPQLQKFLKGWNFITILTD